MLALVRVALTRPYTFVVLALLILIVGPLSALRTPVDIFPEIRIPEPQVEKWSVLNLKNVEAAQTKSQRTDSSYGRPNRARADRITLHLPH